MNTVLAVMRKLWSDLGQWSRRFPGALLLFLSALGYAGWQIIFSAGAAENGVPLWLLGVLLGLRAMSGLKPQSGSLLRARIAAWLLMGLVPLALQLPTGGNFQLDTLTALLLTAFAVILFHNGFAGFLRFLPVLLLTLVIIPIQEHLLLVLSYPLRLISTILTVETFQLFGCEVTSVLTTIRVKGSDIAITDACSGISQVTVLMLLGYIIVVWRHSRLFYAALHYASLVPVVIFANTVRLFLTILLFYAIGEKAFDNLYHSSLGFFFVIFATALFYWIGALFPKKDDPVPNAEKEE